MDILFSSFLSNEKCFCYFCNLIILNSQTQRLKIKLEVKTNGRESAFQTKGKGASVVALSSGLKSSTEFHDGKFTMNSSEVNRLEPNHRNSNRYKSIYTDLSFYFLNYFFC